MTDQPSTVCAGCGAALTAATGYGIGLVCHWPVDARGIAPATMVPRLDYCRPCFETRRANLLPLLERRYPKAVSEDPSLQTLEARGKAAGAFYKHLLEDAAKEE